MVCFLSKSAPGYDKEFRWFKSTLAGVEAIPLVRVSGENRRSFDFAPAGRCAQDDGAREHGFALDSGCAPDDGIFFV
jgi:hypothetical protein